MIGYSPFIKQPLPLYEKNLNPPLFEKISKTQPLLYKRGGGGEGVPTMTSIQKRLRPGAIPTKFPQKPVQEIFLNVKKLVAKYEVCFFYSSETIN